MTVVTRLGSVLSLLNGALAAYLSTFALGVPVHCPSGGCLLSPAAYLPDLLLAVGLILVVDSVVSFRGFRVTFTLGAVLSALLFALVTFQWGSIGNPAASVSLLLSAVTAVIDTVASRPEKAFSEQSHPLNLPVFG